MQEILDDFEVMENSDCSSNTKLKVSSWFEGIQAPDTMPDTMSTGDGLVVNPSLKYCSSKTRNLTKCKTRPFLCKTNEAKKLNNVTDHIKKLHGDENRDSSNECVARKHSYIDALTTDESSSDDAILTSIATSIISKQPRTAKHTDNKKHGDLTRAIQMINNTRAKSRQRKPVVRRDVKDKRKQKGDAAVEYEYEPYEMFLSQQINAKHTDSHKKGEIAKNNPSIHMNIVYSQTITFSFVPLIIGGMQKTKSEVTSCKRRSARLKLNSTKVVKKEQNSKKNYQQEISDKSCQIALSTQTKKTSQDRITMVERINEAEDFDLLFTQQSKETEIINDEPVKFLQCDIVDSQQHQVWFLNVNDIHYLFIY